MELAGEAVEGAGLLHGVQVGALQVFNDGDFHRLLVGDLAQESGDGGLARELRGAPASFAGDELETAVGERAHQHGLHDSIGGDGGSQLSQLLFVHMGAGLEGIAVNLVERHVAGLAPFCVGGSGRGGLHAG